MALLSVENILYAPKGLEKQVIKKRKKFINYESDHLTLLNIFNFFKDVLKTRSKKEAVEFSREHFLNDKSLFKAILIQEQIQEYINQIRTKRSQDVTLATDIKPENFDKQK